LSAYFIPHKTELSLWAFWSFFFYKNKSLRFDIPFPS
jgi:hypothetical protein